MQDDISACKFHSTKYLLNYFDYLLKACKLAKTVSKAVVVAALADDALQMYTSIKEDMAHGTTRNTMEKAANVAGGWAGGLAGRLTS